MHLYSEIPDKLTLWRFEESTESRMFQLTMPINPHLNVVVVLAIVILLFLCTVEVYYCSEGEKYFYFRELFEYKTYFCTW